MKTILIFNSRFMTRNRMNFKTQELADAYFEKRKSKVNVVCEPTDKVFTYINDWGNRIHVQKMY